MKITPITLAFAGMTIALSGCNRPDVDRTTSLPRGVDPSAVVQQTPRGVSAPPVPADRGPVAANANTAAPGTDAAQALASQPVTASNATQELAPAAQEAAARAGDTASADAAKKEVMNTTVLASHAASTSAPTALDTPANSPRHGALTKEQEINELPKAGQVNNHSSTALEKDSGR